jgi:hypothetical protein
VAWLPPARLAALAVEMGDIEAPNLRTVEAKRKDKWPPQGQATEQKYGPDQGTSMCWLALLGTQARPNITAVLNKWTVEPGAGGGGLTASIAFSICLGIILWPLVTSHRPISSTMAVMPSRISSKLALSWLFACSTSAIPRAFEGRDEVKGCKAR